MIVSVFHTCLFIAPWIFLPIASVPDLMAIGILLVISFAAAMITAAFSRKTSVPVLSGLGVGGLIAVVIGVYFWVTVPEAILDVFILLMGGGVLLAVLAVVGDRLVQGSTQKPELGDRLLKGVVIRHCFSGVGAGPLGAT